MSIDVESSQQLWTYAGCGRVDIWTRGGERFDEFTFPMHGDGAVVHEITFSLKYMIGSIDSIFSLKYTIYN